MSEQDPAVCWWSDLLKEWCGHCLGQCDTSGAVIE